MKTIILALFVCISAPAFGVAYVPPNIYAKQYLAELDLKEKLTKAWNNRSSCFVNFALVTDGLGTLSSIKHGGCSKGNCASEGDCETASHACNNHCTNSKCKNQTECEDRTHPCNRNCAMGTWETGTAGVWKATQEAVATGAFNNSNIEVIKMELTGVSGDDDRTFTAYYKRKNLDDYRLNTIDNQICSSSNQVGCYKAECFLEFDPTVGSEKCELSSCCPDCWSITGGF